MKLLVIEDDLRMATLLRRGLAKDGWAIDVVNDAVDARHAVESTPYDVVVCDVGLPGPESGLDWCRWLAVPHSPHHTEPAPRGLFRFWRTHEPNPIGLAN